MSTPATVVIPMPLRREEPPKTKYPKWTPERRAKFMQTAARKRREREAALASKGRARRNTKPKAPRSYGPRRNAALRGPIEPSAVRNTEPTAGRSAKAAAEERADAIVYLQAAAERTEGLSNAELLAALALRRLRGQIK